MKKTKQGVRDLSFIKSKPRGIRLEIPPSEAISCDHKLTTDRFDNVVCKRCFAVGEELTTPTNY